MLHNVNVDRLQVVAYLGYGIGGIIIFMAIAVIAPLIRGHIWMKAALR